ncbi:MAG: tetratricopeptide repeat protein [bacterium]|nr:tetratricopeptide repeat protein [bacterium]
MKLNDSLADGHYNHGVLLSGQQRWDEARQAFERALEINPFYAEAHHNLGYLLETNGQLDSAMDHYRRAVDNKPAYPLAHFHLGRLYVNRRNYEQAINYLHKAISPVNQQTPRYLYALGATYARSGDKSNAFNYLRQAEQAAARFDQEELLTGINRDLEALQNGGGAR